MSAGDVAQASGSQLYLDYQLQCTQGTSVSLRSQFDPHMVMFGDVVLLVKDGRRFRISSLETPIMLLSSRHP